MQRLYPTIASPVDVVAEYHAPQRHRHSQGRAWLGLCMVSSLDGSTVVDGRSGGLSSPADTSVLLALRNAADHILVGASTIRSERYGPPRKPNQRVIVVSRSGEGLDPAWPLFSSGAGVLLTSLSAPTTALETVRFGEHDVDFNAALAAFDADFIIGEGGPQLNAALLDAGLVDEVNVTFSPTMVGGEGPRLTHGALATSLPMELAHLLEEDGFLFSRYVRRDRDGG
jgi:riboflavin biosynthesis pyrimidine reductase